MSVPRPGQPSLPGLEDREELWFRVFSVDGRLLGVVPVHECSSWHEATCWAYLIHHKDRQARGAAPTPDVNVHGNDAAV